MKHWKITDTDGNPSYTSTEDGQTPADVGYDDDRYDWEEVPAEPSETDSAAGPVETDLGNAQSLARLELERHVERALAAIVPEAGQQVFIFFMWGEVQRLKLALRITNGVPADPESRRREYPLIMALSHLSGATPQAVIEIIETRYWPRVRDIALARAQVILVHDQIAQATSAEDMIEIARNANLSPGGM